MRTQQLAAALAAGAVLGTGAVTLIDSADPIRLLVLVDAVGTTVDFRFQVRMGC